mmetsp:Transcript_9885/g.27163  ORF Transcript_9885/g.27163 Transcript_9885/m.27163 type:complete len:271 (-) Transcript_9885:98-910(-)
MLDGARPLPPDALDGPDVGRRRQRGGGVGAAHVGEAQPDGLPPGAHLRLPGLAGHRQRPLRYVLGRRADGNAATLAALVGGDRHPPGRAPRRLPPHGAAERAARQPHGRGADEGPARASRPQLGHPELPEHGARRGALRAPHRCRFPADPQRGGGRELRRGGAAGNLRGLPRGRRARAGLRGPRHGQRGRRGAATGTGPCARRSRAAQRLAGRRVAAAAAAEGGDHCRSGPGLRPTGAPHRGRRRDGVANRCWQTAAGRRLDSPMPTVKR